MERGSGEEHPSLPRKRRRPAFTCSGDTHRTVQAATAEAPASAALALRSVVINQGQMTQLVALGFAIVQPINGLNEGDPEYLVPAMALEALAAEPTPATVVELFDSNLQIDPALLPPATEGTKRKERVGKRGEGHMLSSQRVDTPRRSKRLAQ